MSTMTVATVATPTGPLTIVEADGRVRAAGFTTDVGLLLTLVHPKLRASPRPRADLGAITRAARAYFDGDLTAIDDVPVEQRTDGEFLDHAWHILRQVKAGEPVTLVLVIVTLESAPALIAPMAKPGADAVTVQSVSVTLQ